MDRKMHIVFYGDELGLPPLIATFTLPHGAEDEDVHIIIAEALSSWVSSMDCPPERFAADAVCMRMCATVEFSEASQVNGLPLPEKAVSAKKALVVEYHSDENLLETTLFDTKEEAIAHWRSSYQSADIIWDTIEDVRPDEYYKGRSALDMGNYYEMSVMDFSTEAGTHFQIRLGE